MKSLTSQMPLELAERIARSAEKYRELRNDLGQAFRPVQQEAYKAWVDLQEQLEADDLRSKR